LHLRLWVLLNFGTFKAFELELTSTMPFIMTIMTTKWHESNGIWTNLQFATSEWSQAHQAQQQQCRVQGTGEYRSWSTNSPFIAHPARVVSVSNKDQTDCSIWAQKRKSFVNTNKLARLKHSIQRTQGERSSANSNRKWWDVLSTKIALPEVHKKCKIDIRTTGSLPHPRFVLISNEFCHDKFGNNLERIWLARSESTLWF
jgi:hypothetical protein